jgi:hypothetical protein
MPSPKNTRLGISYCQRGLNIDVYRVGFGAKAAPEMRHVMVEDAELELLNQTIGKHGRESAAQCEHHGKSSDEVRLWIAPIDQIVFAH